MAAYSAHYVEFSHIYFNYTLLAISRSPCQKMRIMYGSVNAWSQVQILRLKASADVKCPMFLRGITIDFLSPRTDVRETHISWTKERTNHVVLSMATSNGLQQMSE